jgi:DNA repair exonuclease SbcCD nuclease subunit
MEEGGTALDPDLFRRFQTDYVALGHIHARREEIHEGLPLVYAGSSRVWRKGEEGERGVYLISVEKGRIAYEFVPLKAAGQFRQRIIPLGLEGEMDQLGSEEWQSGDWVSLIFTGVVEDENVVARLQKDLQESLGSKVRRFEVAREGIAVLPGIAAQSMARAFLEKWRSREPVEGRENERKIWLRARELGLEALRRILESRE